MQYTTERYTSYHYPLLKLNCLNMVNVNRNVVNTAYNSTASTGILEIKIAVNGGINMMLLLLCGWWTANHVFHDRPKTMVFTYGVNPEDQHRRHLRETPKFNDVKLNH